MIYRTLYTEIDLPDKATRAVVEQRLADIAEGRGGNFDIEKTVMDTIVSVLIDPNTKVIYDQILEGLERSDGRLPRIRNLERVEAMKKLCSELGLDFLEHERGKYSVVFNGPRPDGKHDGFPTVIRDFRGLRLEFNSYRYSIAIERRQVTVFVQSLAHGQVSFPLKQAPQYPKSPKIGSSGYLLTLDGLEFETEYRSVPLAFLSDQGKLFVCMNGAEIIQGGDARAISDLFGVRNRGDRVASVIAKFNRICAGAFCELGCEMDVNEVESEFRRVAAIYRGSPYTARILAAVRSVLLFSPDGAA